MFFLVSPPWWSNDEDEHNQGLDRVPARELHYFTIEHEQKKKGVILMYGDMPSFKIWSLYIDNGNAKKENKEIRARMFMSFFGEKLGGDATRIEDSIAVAWQGEAGRGSTVGMLGPGTSMNEVRQAFRGTHLEGFTKECIGIANGSMSDFCGFIEGGLKMASSAMEYLKLTGDHEESETEGTKTSDVGKSKGKGKANAASKGKSGSLAKGGKKGGKHDWDYWGGGKAFPGKGKDWNYATREWGGAWSYPYQPADYYYSGHASKGKGKGKKGY